MLFPITDTLCGWPLHHGERGRELDPEHPDACLCGHPDYLLCDGDGFEAWTLWQGDDGRVYADPAG